MSGAGDLESEVARLTAALREIETKTMHQHCNRCGVCIAHEALYGHVSSPRCCWPPSARSSGPMGRLGSSGYVKVIP